jgi:hypothetical protein
MLSDITLAAGWSILECIKTSEGDLSVRMICTSEDSTTCEHLLAGGAENKIVRLPESCGSWPFARVQKSWIPNDQPSFKGMRIEGRDAKMPKVHALKLDNNFHEIPLHFGQVSLSIEYNPNGPSQLVEGTFDYTAFPLSSSPDSTSTSSFSFVDDIFRIISSITSAPGNVISGIINSVKDFIHGWGSRVRKPSITIPEKVYTNKTSAIPLVLKDQGRQLIGKHVLVDTDIDGSLSYGFLLNATLTPPALHNFSFFAQMNGVVDTKLHVKPTTTKGKGRDTILGRVPLPPIIIPFVISIVPQVSLATNAKVNLVTPIDVTIGTSFDLAHVDFRFPRNSGMSNATPRPMSLQVNSNTATRGGKGTFEAWLSPRISFDINLLSGPANKKASIFLDTEFYTNAQLEVEPLSHNTTHATRRPTIPVEICLTPAAAIRVHGGSIGGIPGVIKPDANFSVINTRLGFPRMCVKDVGESAFGLPMVEEEAIGGSAIN